MSRKRPPSIRPAVLASERVALTDAERRLILETADAMVDEAGRSTLVLALRGSRNKKLEKFQAETLPGFGCYRGMPEADVLARVDQLIHEELLRIESRDGFPLLGFTPQGLELAEGWTAERWLGQLREHVADPSPFHPTFAFDRMPERNRKTLHLLLDALETEADPSWLPMLRHWHGAEVKKVRARLSPLIARLEGKLLESKACP
jgi:superfamily II DNA helicase RecQ